MTMEILNNFSSIYCFIAFVIGAVFMLTMLSIAAMGKVKDTRNKVRFFVEAIGYNIHWLYIQKKNGDLELVASNNGFKDFGLNPLDFADIKEGEIREVFINLED